MPQDSIHQEILKAIRAGDKPRARDLLTRLLKTSPSSPDDWLLMSSVVDSDKERIYCLREALRIDPRNEGARRGLIFFGAMPAGEPPSGRGPSPRRSWVARQVEGQRAKPAELEATRKQLMIWSGAGVLSILLLVFGLVNAGRPANSAASGPLSVPTARASATFLPTPPPEFPTPTPTFAGARPLVLLLSATYTPTPFYGVTPHPISEAYKSGLAQLALGNWAAAADLLQQVTQNEPDAVDAYYLTGEAYRLEGDFKNAVAQYNQAIQVQPSYAPAYLGRARANLASDLKADVEGDLKKAVQLDSLYGEADLELGSYYLTKGDTPDALKALQSAVSLLPGSPMVNLRLAQADLASGDAAGALQAAQRANAQDVTLLSGYLELGIAEQANQQLAASLKPLETYLLYAPDDTAALLLVGKAYISAGQNDRAEAAFTHALQVDPHLIDGLIARGGLYLDTGKGEQALGDFNAALKLNASSFDANLGRGRALLASGDAANAHLQFLHTQQLAADDPQRGEAIYYDALALEAANNLPAAVKRWQSLLALPGGAVSDHWRADAQAHLDAILTPAPAPATPTAAASSG